jgi:hypothetical protein
MQVSSFYDLPYLIIIADASTGNLRSPAFLVTLKTGKTKKISISSFQRYPLIVVFIMTHTPVKEVHDEDQERGRYQPG